MQRTIRILSFSAIGLWFLVVVLSFGVAVLLPGLRGMVLASLLLFALGGLVAAVAWLLGVGSAARTRRWGWLAVMLLPGLAFTAIALLAFSVLPDFPGDDPLVMSLFIATLLAPATTWMYSQRPSESKDPPHPLSTVDDLLRSAQWEGLPAAEQARLRASYGALAARPASGRPVLIDHVSDTPTQDWVARLIAPQFQRDAASVIRTWLEDASPSAHLVVFGRAGHGRTSLVASLARQAMAGRPPRPDYCAVPDPAALDRPRVLQLPAGTAEPFARELRTALELICDSWDEASDSSLLDPFDAPRPGPRSAPRPEQMAGLLDPVQRVAPDEQARAYLRELQAALERLAAAGGAPTFCQVEVRRVGVCRDTRSPDASAGGAPVVVYSRMREGGILDALRCANGGILVVPSSELVDGTGSLSGDAVALQIVLSTGALPDNPREEGSPSVPHDVRVALITSGRSINEFANVYDDFYHAFRYEASFDGLTDWTPAAEAVYAALADGVAARYHLPAFDPSGVARLVEEGARRVGSGAGGLARFRLATNLLDLHDLIVEAAKVAHARHAVQTAGADVEAAVERRRKEYGVYARRAREEILSGKLYIPTAGAAVGQINGLGVYLGDPLESSFATPLRISAVVGPGHEERLVDIEHEADAADGTHYMGALTMAGYLAERYGREHPISAVVRIRFEQHYAVGGPSASGAELFALLSALARAPIASSMAVTGAVGQYGEIQTIGGVNQKIEGFWEICRKRRSLGENPGGSYGVLIPEANTKDLMLRREVAESIANDGWFHVWPIRTVDDALPLLTGLPAEEIHRRAGKQLYRFYRRARRRSI